MPANPTAAPTRKRQWGAERSTEPLPTIHVRPSDRQIAMSRLAIVATVVFWVVYIVYTILRQFIDNGTQNFRFTSRSRL
jgi:cellulose synthase (UDP-forming)